MRLDIVPVRDKVRPDLSSRKEILPVPNFAMCSGCASGSSAVAFVAFGGGVGPFDDKSRTARRVADWLADPVSRPAPLPTLALPLPPTGTCVVASWSQDMLDNCESKPILPRPKD